MLFPCAVWNLALRNNYLVWGLFASIYSEWAEYWSWKGLSYDSFCIWSIAGHLIFCLFFFSFITAEVGLLWFTCFSASNLNSLLNYFTQFIIEYLILFFSCYSAHTFTQFPVFSRYIWRTRFYLWKIVVNEIIICLLRKRSCTDDEHWP